MQGISAVVATYKRKDELVRLFNSILANDLKNIEVIIVDQNTDQLLEATIAEFAQLLDIRHVKLTEPNQSKARNIGAKLAKFPLICFPDDDCWFENNSLTGVSNFFSAEADTDLLIINWKQNPNIFNESVALTREQMFSFRSVGYVTYVMFFKTQKFLKLGGFLEEIGIGKYIGGGEDSELAFRAVSNDYKVFFKADIFVNHKYISIYSRDLPVIRARQRAMGLMYSMYEIPKYIVVRGMVSPIVKMVFSFNVLKMKQHYNLLRARIEGYRFGNKNRKILMESIKKNQENN